MTLSLSFLFLLLACAAYVFFLSRRLPRYLHMFQQEEYDSPRFLRWLIATRSFDRRVSAALIVAGLIAGVLPGGLENLFPAMIFALFTPYEDNPRLAAKKKLVMTPRATRIYVIAFVLSVGAGVWTLYAGAAWGALLTVQALPLSLMVANTLLIPYEHAVQKRIRAEASAKLLQIAPRVVGITGSFGKTSVKHILGHVMELNAPTLYTPGSVNTLMGISRVIREKLQANCRFFLVEMGAYRRGSIEKLCRLTPPQAGVITALGAAHYERFQSLDAVARAKFELAEAVVASGKGPVVIHDSVLQQDYARAYVTAHRAQFVICGPTDEADVKITSLTQSAQGLNVSLLWQDKTYALFAPLFGLQHGDNMTLAFATAVSLGIEPALAIAALRSVPQITHRLQVKPQADGSIMIDDAYNANPIGFKAALDLLALLACENGGRRIVITPGVTELGAQHDVVHRDLGAAAAQNADIVIPVRPDRIPSFVEGFQAVGGKGTLVPVANLTAARAWIGTNGQAKDIVLFENDLPDVYERKLDL